MKVNLSKRGFSSFIDFSMVLSVIYLLFILLASNIIQNKVENYTEHQALYNENLETLNDQTTQLDDDLKDEIITEDQHKTQFDKLMSDFNDDNEEYAATLLSFGIVVVMYFLVSFAIINYLYNLVFMGQTIGRKMMKIRLEGNVNWYSLLMRELFYKSLFWYATFSAGIAIDIGMIAFTKSKKAIRDHVSGTYLVHEGTQYPF